MELKECRLRLAEERRARLKAESRLMEVNKSINLVFCFLTEERDSFETNSASVLIEEACHFSIV